mmetsp:Transcript_3538/g.5331  ORF Transcript_3538/g.5331 Transcript_3538/m.5331 type:complete len:96 (+) Transcript_3538:635-922(+)
MRALLHLVLKGGKSGVPLLSDHLPRTSHHLVRRIAAGRVFLGDLTHRNADVLGLLARLTRHAGPAVVAHLALATLMAIAAWSTLVAQAALAFVAL